MSRIRLRINEQHVKEAPVRGETYVWNIEDQTAYFLQSELEGKDTKHSNKVELKKIINI